MRILYYIFILLIQINCECAEKIIIGENQMKEHLTQLLKIELEDDASVNMSLSNPRTKYLIEKYIYNSENDEKRLLSDYINMRIKTYKIVEGRLPTIVNTYIENVKKGSDIDLKTIIIVNRVVELAFRDID